jgi:tetratricopeptide (TPR) repeat protein
MAGNAFHKYLLGEREKCETLLKDSGAYDKVPEQRSSDQIHCYRKLGSIYLYSGETDLAGQMFSNLSLFGTAIKKSRFDIKGFKEEYKSDLCLLMMEAEGEVNNAIYLFLAEKNPDQAHRLVTWAVENSDLSPDYVRGRLGVQDYSEVAVGYLWHGYALICLGRYGEALPLLREVTPLFVQERKSGIEVWQKVEYALPKALVPLCEFKLDPTADRLKAAQEGIETYLKSLKMYRDRLSGLLYYFHLKKQFADIYEINPASFIPPGGREIKQPAPEPIIGREKDPEGEIVLTLIRPDPPTLWAMEWLGQYAAFEAFTTYVRSLGGYPALEALMDTYTLEERQEAAPILEDCERFLRQQDISPEARAYAEVILSALQAAVWQEGTMPDDAVVEIIHETGA